MASMNKDSGKSNALLLFMLISMTGIIVAVSFISFPNLIYLLAAVPVVIMAALSFSKANDQYKVMVKWVRPLRRAFKLPRSVEKVWVQAFKGDSDLLEQQLGSRAMALATSGDGLHTRNPGVIEQIAITDKAMEHVKPTTSRDKALTRLYSFLGIPSRVIMVFLQHPADKVFGYYLAGLHYNFIIQALEYDIDAELILSTGGHR